MAKARKGTIVRGESKLKIRITITDRDGKVHRPWLPLDPSFDDETARRIAAQVSAKAQNQPWDPARFKRQRKHKVSTALTCDEYVEKLWFPSRAAKVRSIRSDRYRWRLHLRPLIGHVSIEDVTSDLLRDVVERLDEKASDDEVRFGAKSARNCWALLSKMFADAVGSKRRELRVLSVNPAIGVRAPDPPGPVEKQWLFPVELQQLLACPSVPLERRRFYAAAVYCYTRPGETVALLWGRSIDLEHGMVRVNRSYDHIADEFREHTKTEDSRHFALEPVLRPMLAAMWRERPRPGLVFRTLKKLAEVLRDDLMTAGVTRAALHVKRPGALRIRFHDLRATGITFMAIRGDSDHDVRERAGHSDFETTLLYIRRGHLASKTIGEPYAPLPAELIGDNESSLSASQSSALVSVTTETQDTIIGAGEGIRILEGADGAGGDGKTTGNPGTAAGADQAHGTNGDDSGDDSEPPLLEVLRLPPDIQDRVAELLGEAYPHVFDQAVGDRVLRPLAKAAELIDGEEERQAGGFRG